MIKLFKKNKILFIALLSLLLSVSITQNISYAIVEGSASDELLQAAENKKTEAAIGEAVKQAANVVTGITCSTGQALYDKDGKPLGCIVPPTQLNKDLTGKVIGAVCPTGSQAYYSDTSGVIAALTGKLIGASSEFTGCIGPASTVTRAGDNADPNTSKITQSVKPYKMQVGIPCQPLAGGQCPDTQSGSALAAYITRLYQFGLMIVGLFAFGGIVYGSFKYILSAGSMADQSDAKDQITQAVIGLTLLLGAYTILYTINPRLVSLRDPELVPLNVADLTAEEVDPGQTSQISGSQTGSVDPLCKYNVNVGIDVRFNSSLGTIGGPQSGSTCLSCRENASKDGSGTCGCNAGFQLDNNACVSVKQLQDACNSKTGFIWRNNECADEKLGF